MSTIQITAEYRTWFKTIKDRISSSRIKASLSVNHELIALYWFLGSQIAEKQKMASWGSGFIRYCRVFYHFYIEPEIWQQAVAKFENDPNNQNRQQLVAKNEQLDISETTAL